MTDDGFTGEHIRDVWQRYIEASEAQKPTCSVAESWQQVKAQRSNLPPIQTPSDMTFTAKELTDFFDFRARPGLSTWGEFCADNGYSFSEAIQPLIDKKTMEYRRSIVATVLLDTP